MSNIYKMLIEKSDDVTITNRTHSIEADDFETAIRILKKMYSINGEHIVDIIKTERVATNVIHCV